MGSKDQESPDATLLMNAAAGGDSSAMDRLMPLVYERLRVEAQKNLASERAGHTLSATALVHEAYLKLVGPREVPWASQAHFYAAAAEAMRRVLLDHARARSRDKRGGVDGKPARRVDSESLADLAISEDGDDIVSFDAALRRLEQESPEAARVVQLRFFAGLTVEQVAAAMSVSDRTVNRLWLFARAWLHRAITNGDVKA